MSTQQVPERVLIVAQGYHRERILAPVSYHSANRVIMLRNEDDPKEIQSILKTAIQELKKDLLSKNPDGFPLYPFMRGITEVYLNFFDLPKSISKISSIIRQERDKGNEVIVDISSGNKTIAIAMFIAARINAVEVTYAISGSYGDPEFIEYTLAQVEKAKGERYTYAIERIQRLPNIPICLEKTHFDILELLEKKGGYANSVTELIGSKEKSDIIRTSRKLRQLILKGYVAQSWKGYKITDEGIAVMQLKSCSGQE